MPYRPSRRWRSPCRCWKATPRCASASWRRFAPCLPRRGWPESAIPNGIVARVDSPYTPAMLDQPTSPGPVAQRTKPEHSFAEEVPARRLGDGEVFRGEGGALIVVGEDYGEGASIIQERAHAYAVRA